MSDIETPKRRRRRKVDPRKVLAEIASDPNASAALRYRAANALLADDRASERRKLSVAEAGADDVDPITRRALQIAAERNRTIN